MRSDSADRRASATNVPKRTHVPNASAGSGCSRISDGCEIAQIWLGPDALVRHGIVAPRMVPLTRKDWNENDACSGTPASRAHGAPVPVAAPLVRRLIGDTRLVAAIGQADDRFAAAEEEVRVAGIADRPVALVFAQLEDRAALADRDDVLERLGLGLDLGLVGRDRLGGERGVAAHGIAHAAEHVRGRARLARPRPGAGRRLGASREAEAMHLADDRVARDP